jgi:hypothetical protein
VAKFICHAPPSEISNFARKDAPTLLVDRSGRFASEYANGVKRNLPRSSHVNSAAQSHAEGGMLTRSVRSQPDHVPSAANNSILTGLANQHAVAVAVSRLDTVAGGRVYNLKVDGMPEYFANGILVHNCGEFPFGAHDDMISASSLALWRIRDDPGHGPVHFSIPRNDKKSPKQTGKAKLKHRMNHSGASNMYSRYRRSSVERCTPAEPHKPYWRCWTKAKVQHSLSDDDYSKLCKELGIKEEKVEKKVEKKDDDAAK